MSLQASTFSLRINGHSIVDDAAFTVPRECLTALVGPNGAGKSTLLRLISGTQAADSGRVLFNDVSVLDLPRRQRAQQVALVEQEAHSEFALTVRQSVQLGRIPFQSMWSGLAEHDREVVDEALRRARALEFADRPYTTLSGGEQQRVHLARALAQEPELMLLDEPTNHLDVQAQLRTLTLLRSLTTQGMTVLAALHDLNLAVAFCDYVIVMKDARVHSVGRVDDIVTSQLVADVYGVEADVLEHPRTGRPLIAFS